MDEENFFRILKIQLTQHVGMRKDSTQEMGDGVAITKMRRRLVSPNRRTYSGTDRWRSRKIVTGRYREQDSEPSDCEDVCMADSVFQRAALRKGRDTKFGFRHDVLGLLKV